jgi:hypothetical protein
MSVGHQPVEHLPDRLAGDLDGLYSRHDGPDPVMIRVQWTDGSEGEIDAWTSRWTRTHVCVYRDTTPPKRPFWVRVVGGNESFTGAAH